MISVLNVFLLLQISFCCKNESEERTKIQEIYKIHERINDENGFIILKKALFSNFKNSNINGSAIYINKNHYNCTLSSCKFENCVSKFGGAIYLKSKNQNDPHSCSIYNALFTNCKAINGGALYFKVGETNSHSISIEGCTFKFNIATKNGGAIYGLSREKVSIQRCKFNNNQASVKGSSIWCRVGNENTIAHHKLILYRDSFSFSANSNNMVNVYIESSNLSLTQKPNANVFIGLCSFSSQNGSFYSYKNLEVFENGKFETFNLTECNCIQGSNDTVSFNFNLLDIFNDLLFFDCMSIDECQAESIISQPPVTGECDQYPNRQDYVGGSGVEFEKACFSNFRSPILQDGGAIHVINAQVDLETCCFTNCTTEGNGGALFVILSFLDCEIEIEECIFDSCSASENGGAVYVYVSENNNELEVDDTRCQFCSSGRNGGAFYVYFDGKNCNIEFEESTFDSNTAIEEGGAIYFVSKKASRSTYEEIKFVNNSATNAGAFYYSPFSFSKLCRSDFINNTCTGPNCSSSVLLLIDPSKDDENEGNEILINSKTIKIYGDDNDKEDGKDEDDGDEESEDDDEYDDEIENIKEDTFDNMTIRNVALNDNIFISNPLHDSNQVKIEMKKNAKLSLGKNSFSFNGRDEESDEMNSKYFEIEQDDSSNVSFRFDGFICLYGNSTKYDSVIDNIKTNCPIVKLNPDLDGESKQVTKSQRKKIILISSIVIGSVTAISLAIIVTFVIIQYVNDRKVYTTKISDDLSSNYDNYNSK